MESWEGRGPPRRRGRGHGRPEAGGPSAPVTHPCSPAEDDVAIMGPTPLPREGGGLAPQEGCLGEGRRWGAQQPCPLRPQAEEALPPQRVSVKAPLPEISPEQPCSLEGQQTLGSSTRTHVPKGRRKVLEVGTTWQLCSAKCELGLVPLRCPPLWMLGGRGGALGTLLPSLGLKFLICKKMTPQSPTPGHGGNK